MRTPRDVGAATTGVFIYRDDVDAHYEVTKAAGAEIVHPPKDAEYGRNYWAPGMAARYPRSGAR
jgi:uncharacterized glyoxalase superfamily protein PhnB